MAKHFRLVDLVPNIQNLEAVLPINIPPDVPYFCVYRQIMEPSIKGLRPGSAHAIVCSFVRECAARGLRTECTVVNRDDVDVTSARELATKLGACCRARPYLP